MGMAIPVNESRFLEIGYKKGKVTIKTETVINPELDESEISEHVSRDEPLDSFHAALQQMAADVVTICELPDDYVDDMHISKVTFNYSNDGIQGACIIAYKNLSDKNAGVVNICSPNCPQMPYSEHSTWCMMPDMVKRVQQLEHEAMRYLAGERETTQPKLEGMEEAMAATRTFAKAANNIVGGQAEIDVTKDAKGGTVVSITKSSLSKGF